MRRYSELAGHAMRVLQKTVNGSANMKTKKIVWVLVSVIIILVVIIIAMMVSGMNKPKAETPADAVDAFFTSVRAEDYKTAREYLTYESNKAYDDNVFRMYKELFDFTAADPNSVKISVGGNEATETILNATGSEGVTANVNLLKEEGSWKIESVVLNF